MDRRDVDRLIAAKCHYDEAWLRIRYNQEQIITTTSINLFGYDELREVSKATGEPIKASTRIPDAREVEYNGCTFWCHIFDWSDTDGD